MGIDSSTSMDTSVDDTWPRTRLVPSTTAEADVPAFRGTRHTSARRYSHDDPAAVVIAVSEDGPVSVFRNGAMVGHSPALWLP